MNLFRRGLHLTVFFAIFYGLVHSVRGGTRGTVATQKKVQG